MDNKLKIALYSIVGILLATVIALGILWSNSEKQNEEMQELFALEKEELEGETKTKLVQENLENEAKGRQSFSKKGIEVRLQHILG